MEDIYKISRDNLLKDFRKRRSNQSRNFSKLKNVGSEYYDSCKAYLELTNRIVMLIEESPDNLEQYRKAQEPASDEDVFAWLNDDAETSGVKGWDY